MALKELLLDVGVQQQQTPPTGRGGERQMTLAGELCLETTQGPKCDAGS